MSVVAVTDYSFEDLSIEKGILDPLGCRVDSLKSGRDLPALLSLVREADFVITQFAPLTAEVIGAMKACRLVVRYGIGVDNVDLAAAAARGIPVCNIPDYCTDEVADHALAMILELTRRVAENAIEVRAGSWGLAVPVSSMRTLKDMTVGVVGFGRIGRGVAARLAPFKPRILVHDPAVPASTIGGEGFAPVSLEELLRGSDLVTLHCPSTEKTRRMIDARSMAAMKPGALLVNVSRGTLVHTDDLVDALRGGKIAAAALDVVDPEPIPAGHPLVGMRNVLLNAHIASTSAAAVRKLRSDAAGLVALAVRGGDLPNVVNGVARTRGGS